MVILLVEIKVPDSKVHGANMELIWGRQDPDGPHIDPMNFAIWGFILAYLWHYHQCYQVIALRVLSYVFRML